MRINFRGRLVDEPEIRAGFIGCGSHSFRNVYPTFQFAPVNLVATCDLQIEKARAFAAKFGAERAYTDYQEMLTAEDLDAVFVVTGYDEQGRPTYPDIVVNCVRAGCHVWIEKPPAATTVDIERMQQACRQYNKQVMVGLKKMFFPANEKAKELMNRESFGTTSLVTLQYPQYIPTISEFNEYLVQKKRNLSTGFLDHLCHPMSIMVFLLGMPETLFYQRSPSGAGLATFTYDSGVIASLALSWGAARNGGMERIMIVSDAEKHILVENCLHVSYNQGPPDAPGTGYGSAPNFYTGDISETIACWKPEFSLGQLYNKGLFLLGYYGEVNEFARAILEDRPLEKGTLEQAWQVTRIFEGFAKGPGQVIALDW